MATSIQCWPHGTSFEYEGDPHGPGLKVRKGWGADRDAEFRPATEDEHRAIKIEVIAQRLMDQEIYCLDSCLVDELIKTDWEGVMSGSDLEGAFTYEKVVNLRPDPSDWDLEKCKEWLEDNGHDLPDPNPWEMDREELLGALHRRPDDAGGENDDALRAEVIEDMDKGHYNDGLDAWREAVTDNAEDAEIMEWYRVSSWLAEKLKAADECVLDNDYGTWWGRCCTGQAYKMDGTFQRIAARML